MISRGGLVEIRRCDARGLGTLNHTARILSVDTTSVVEADRNRNGGRHAIADTELRLEASCALIAGRSEVVAVCCGVTELVPSQPACRVKAHAQEINNLVPV